MDVEKCILECFNKYCIDKFWLCCSERYSNQYITLADCIKWYCKDEAWKCVDECLKLKEQQNS